MTLRIPLIYEPSITKIETEQDIVELLKDVRKDIRTSNSKLVLRRLREVLIHVEEGKYIHNGESRIETEIDLSKATFLVNEYKQKSARNCIVCNNREIKSTEDIGDYNVWCSLTEIESDVDSRQGHSPRIKEYYEKGCDDYHSNFRSLEQVLAEAELT